MNFTKGEVIAINKPLGMTSFCALAIVRKRICVRLGVKKIKIGHAGTLDPLASGVLVLCTGKFTKRIEEFQMHGKEYTATIQLGATTPSYDMEHPVNATYPTDGITRERIEEVLKQFVGRHRAGSADILGVQGGRTALLRPAPKGSGRGAEAEADTHRRDRAHGVRPRNDADVDTCGVRKRHIHPRLGTRHRSCAQLRRLSHGSLPHTLWRTARGELHRTRQVRGVACQSDNRNQ